ncbi:MAG: M23 family metallopeptidase [Spirochaetota bacterium]|jgi:murein DD-endopeptidase MepM/ murein hydrolase activator NlpD
MNKNKIIFFVITLFFIIMIGLLFYSIKVINHQISENTILKPADIFANEDEYIAYIQSIKIPGVSFTVSQIEKGDNFWKIAKEHNIDIDTLIGANPLWESIVAKVDQKIVIPSQKGVLHFVNDLNEINTLHTLYNVPENNVLTPSLFFYRIKSLVSKLNKPVAVYIKDARPITDVMTPQLAKQFALREMFRSPLGGRLTSFFGGRVHPIFRQWGFHNGLDIAASYGTPVGAARGGVVISSGWMGGYGKAVIIQHDEGFKTLYGHLSTINVRPGQKVKAGQFLGRVGSTGWSTGPHLHFTLWQYNKLINPMKVLW